MSAPIAIFAYNRADHLQKTIESLELCNGLSGRHVFVFCDGIKDTATKRETEACLAVQELANSYVTKGWNIQIAPQNQGLARAVHAGVSAVLAKYPAIIVLEDDLVLAADFLEFMDSCLHQYENRRDIYSISAYTHENLNVAGTGGVFLFPRAGSWGWATWAEKWQGFELDNIDKSAVANASAMKKFNEGGPDLSWMLRNQLKGKVNSWAVQWTYFQFVNGAVSVYPDCSKVKNIGFDGNATHTKLKIQDGMGVICRNTIIPLEDVQLLPFRVRRYRKYYKIGLFSRIKNFVYTFLRWSA